MFRVIVDEDLMKYCQKTFKKYERIRFSIFAIFWKVLVKCIFCHISGTSEDIESILVANYLLMIQHLHFGGSWIWDNCGLCAATQGTGVSELEGVEPNRCRDMIGYNVGYQNPNCDTNLSRQ